MKKAMREWAEEIWQTAKAHGWHEDGGTPFQQRDTQTILFHAELSEATEEARKGRPMLYVYGERPTEGRAEGVQTEGIAARNPRASDSAGRGAMDDHEEERRTEEMEAIRAMRLKPEGAAVEMIDCVIRILDYSREAYGSEGPFGDREEWEDFAMDEERLREEIGWELPGMTLPPLAKMGLEELIVRAHYLISLAWATSDRSGHIHPRILEGCSSLLICWLEAHGIDAEAVMALKDEYNRGRPWRHGGKVF